ncbi:MAG TPA: hypothetical protein VFE05_13535 [Longimicrobiaceae bacterium]|nr:hypothetical protein [Longimicrobiaceae bacterium]
MKVLYSMLCENANERQDGRLDVHGVFTQLYAPGFPAQQDTMTLIVVMEWAEGERGDIPFAIDLLDPSGSPVGTINGQSTVSDGPAFAGPPQTRVVMELNGVVFPVPGAYEFSLKALETQTSLTWLHLIENPGAVN